MNTFMKIITAACDDVATPRAALVKALVRKESWIELAQLKVSPADYGDSESYFKDCFITDLLRKCDLPATIDREKKAKDTFLTCERENALTNARLTRYLKHSEYLPDETDVRVADFISQWRKDVTRVMGFLPNHLTPRFSKGSTYGDVGKLITIPDKMSSVPLSYRQTQPLESFFYDTSWGLGVTLRQSSIGYVRGNIFFTVPKDAQAFRGCCKEASVPLSFQLDAGRLLKARIRTGLGIDLLTAKPTHQRLAREASVSGLQATVDMSNASDTLCRVLPELVCPAHWWELLNSLRATHTRVDGKWFRLEKFSSMGNGFTFELETILFATLARTVISQEGGDPDQVSCNGDDLIIPSPHYASVVAALRFFGFTPNMKKTFWEGPFRESCGGDFFNGVPVRAHFLKKLPDEPQEWISFANGIRRISLDDRLTPEVQAARWSMLRRTWHMILDQIPKQIRDCRGPTILGDIVIHDLPEYWHKVATPVQEPGWDVVSLRAYCPIATTLSWDYWTPAVQLASCTLGLPSAGVTPRDGISGYRIRRVTVMPHDA